MLSSWTPDGTGLLFQAAREGDVYREPRPYVVPVAGGPIRRVHDAHGRAPRIAPGGATVVTKGRRWRHSAIIESTTTGRTLFRLTGRETAT